IIATKSFPSLEQRPKSGMSSAVVHISARRPGSAERAPEEADASVQAAARAARRRSKALLSAVVVVLGALLGMVHLATVILKATAGSMPSLAALPIFALLAAIATAVGLSVSRRGFATLLGQLRRRPDSECEQIMIRLAIALVLCGYVTVSQSLAGYVSGAMQVSLVVLGAFEAASLGLLLWLVLRPTGISEARRVAGAILDYTTLFAALHLGDAVTAPLYGISLFITLGYGFRSGINYLLVSALLSAVSFGAVIATTPLWHNQGALSAGLWLALIAVPAYVSKL